MRKERATRRMPDGDAPPRSYPAKKDKKRWCGGHEGREHKIAVGHKKAWVGMRLQHVPVIRFCETCGKELDIYFLAPAAAWWRRPIPEWAAQFLEAEAARAGTLEP